MNNFSLENMLVFSAGPHSKPSVSIGSWSHKQGERPCNKSSRAFISRAVTGKSTLVGQLSSQVLISKVKELFNGLQQRISALIWDFSTSSVDCLNGLFAT